MGPAKRGTLVQMTDKRAQSRLIRTTLKPSGTKLLGKNKKAHEGVWTSEPREADTLVQTTEACLGACTAYAQPFGNKIIAIR